MSISEVDEGDRSIEISQDILEDFLEESEPETEPEINVDYPNEAYADLMTLVTKYKLTNATGNAIIKFFNKHANVSMFILPKSIEVGRKYMDKMNVPNLEFSETHVTTYNNNNYYLNHRSLIKCVKNILSIPNLSRDFTLNFEKLEVRNLDNASLCYYIMYIYLALL